MKSFLTGVIVGCVLYNLYTFLRERVKRNARALPGNEREPRPPLPTELIICPDCNGSGQLFYSAREHWECCERCDGAGKMLAGARYGYPYTLDSDKAGNV